MFNIPSKLAMPSPDEALSGRDSAMQISAAHAVLNTPICPPFPVGFDCVLFGLGCFWGAERKFWTLPGVFTTAVGYSAGYTPNPTYQEVCSGQTGHNEVVLVVFDSAKIGFQELLIEFFESHNPTQGMRQGNDSGTQYRSGIYTYNKAHKDQAEICLEHYEARLVESGFGVITTEILPAAEFYYAEEYHQQYLAKNPNGYCGLGGTGVRCIVS